MSVIIFHGNHTVESRDSLLNEISKRQSRGIEIFKLEAKQLSPSSLESELGSNTLFDSAKCVVIEELHSLPTSKKRDELVSLINSSPSDVLLWEKKKLTATQLKKFPNSLNREHNISTTLFSWLDSLGSNASPQKKLNLLHDAVKQDGAQFCFLMLARQTRLLLTSIDGGQVAGAPFVQSKLKKQAHFFTQGELLGLHKKLLQIDTEQKTSTATLKLEQELDMLTLSM
ncbi:MAG: hypothetical protein COY80_01195 [Candidatus Pacebacteria bacterium CG_4_10_14_0_8_um_filter_42_14]|nr:MAG: hypothetical protein COY80_01195 [Candidatus Pacebacteria bacterium CG_4_10_14_0_8_um_filter_42_14]